MNAEFHDAQLSHQCREVAVGQNLSYGIHGGGG